MQICVGQRPFSYLLPQVLKVQKSKALRKGVMKKYFKKLNTIKNK